MISINALRGLVDISKNPVYDLLKTLPIYISVDVGAADGGVAEKIKQASKMSRVICFEPFPGNWPYFEKRLKGVPGIALHKNAVDEVASTQIFTIPSTVKGTEKGWENKKGYSSGGHLAKRRSSAHENIEVECVRIDDVLRQHISFLKIDVQGSEFSVIKSAGSLIKGQLIDMVFCEYSGNGELVQYMHDHGYVVFDTDWLVVLKHESDLGKLPACTKHKVVEMSNGKVGTEVEFHEMPRGVDAYNLFMKKISKNAIAVQTDLLFVSRRFMGVFLNGLAKVS